MNTPDFSLANHGSIVILTALSPEGRAWEWEHLPEDRMTWAGGAVVAPRHIGDILDGIAAAGLTVAEE